MRPGAPASFRRFIELRLASIIPLKSRGDLRPDRGKFSRINLRLRHPVRIPAGGAFTAIQAVFGEQRSGLHNRRGRIEQNDFRAARRPVHRESVTNEKRVLAARNDTTFLVPVAKRPKSIAVRRAPTEPHLAFVPMASGKPRLHRKRLSSQRKRAPPPPRFGLDLSGAVSTGGA